jgi:cell filamentation protein
VTFDPFGDFETKGYLRNAARAKDRDIVRRMEHSAFTTALDGAFADLAKRKTLTYDDVLATHKALFDAVYPWAGGDRLKHAPDLAISKGEVRFADPPEIQRSVEWALKRGQDPDVMTANPGTVMGYLAYGHPFLDGNGPHHHGGSLRSRASGRDQHRLGLDQQDRIPRGAFKGAERPG